MKLIIDVDEKLVCEGFERNFTEEERDILIRAVRDGVEYVEPKKGKWIEGKNGTIKCNQCSCEIRYSYLIGNKPQFPKFCCDCGARKETDNEQ